MLLDVVEYITSYVINRIGTGAFETWVRDDTSSAFVKLIAIGDLPLLPPPPFPEHELNEGWMVLEEDSITWVLFADGDLQQAALAMRQPHAELTEAQLLDLRLGFSHFFATRQLSVKESELQSLVASIHAASASLELEELLSQITARALAVLPLAECGLLQLYSSEERTLYTQGCVGFTDSIRRFLPEPGEGITGKVFEDGKPRLLLSRESMYEAMINMSPQNYEALHQAVDSRSIKALISVPVSIGAKRIGVMTVYQLHREGRLTNRHMQLLQAFADQAAVSIQNATLYTEVRRQLEQVTCLSEQLRESNEFLLRRNEIHDALTSLSLQNKGIVPILRELQRMIGRSVYFVNLIDMDYYPDDREEDRRFSLDEISALFAGRKTPIVVETMDRLRGPARHSLHPIFGGNTVLGCLIIPLRKPLTRLVHITLEQGNSVLALELVKKLALTEVYYKKSHLLFNELLQNKEPELLLSKGKEFGLNLNAGVTVVRLEIDSPSDHEALNMTTHRLIHLLKREIADAPHLAFGLQNKVTLLITRQEGMLAALGSRVHAAIQQCRGGGIRSIAAGIGSTGRGIAHIGRSYDEAGKALAYMAHRSGAAVMHYEAIGVNRLFLNEKPQEIERYCEEILSPLLADRSSSDLLRTLQVYVRSGRSANLTAERLHIHINTLYNRIRRIEELLELDFGRFEDYLKVQLACHLRETFPPQPESSHHS